MITDLTKNVTRVNVNGVDMPIGSKLNTIPEGTDLLTFDWNKYSNGDWFKGKNLVNTPTEIVEHTEVVIQLVKYENERYAIQLYHTGLYEGNTGLFINYHYADKFKGWEKISTGGGAGGKLYRHQIIVEGWNFILYSSSNELITNSSLAKWLSNNGYVSGGLSRQYPLNHTRWDNFNRVYLLVNMYAVNETTVNYNKVTVDLTSPDKKIVYGSSTFGMITDKVTEA